MNNTSASPYWSDVRLAERELAAAAAKSALQPKDGAVWIVSLKPRRGADPSIVAGRVSAATLFIAAQRVVDGSHEIASDAVISAYLAEQVEVRKALETESARLRGQITFTQPKPVV